MTIGERIQNYRKKLGLSQEELGAKLHLSRQTVSLWEKGQTFPTIDNLIRLKEIFGVSIDEMVDGEATETHPLEEYTVSFEENELAPVVKHRRRSLVKNFVPSLVLWTLSIIILILLHADVIFIGFIAGALFVDTSFSVKSINEKYKEFKRKVINIEKSTVRLRIFDKSVVAEFIENGETVSEVSEKIDLVTVGENCGFVELTVGSKTCYIKRENVINNSFVAEKLK